MFIGQNLSSVNVFIKELSKKILTFEKKGNYLSGNFEFIFEDNILERIFYVNETLE